MATTNTSGTIRMPMVWIQINIMQKSNLTFANDIERERTKKHLEKGNITQVTFQQENRQIQGLQC